MHLSFAPGIRRNLGRMVQFWYFFFPCGGGELFSFRNDFAGPRGHTHGICSRQCDRQGEKCLTWYHGRCVKMSKRRAKKLDTFVYFCQWKVWWNGLTMKGWKKVMLFLTTSNRLRCGCSYFPLGKSYSSLILCSLPGCFEWFLFVTKSNSAGVSRGSTHEEANDKCISP